jgi:outer membrane protein TolC
VLDLVNDVERAYWDYVGYVHDLRVRDEYIKVAEQTVSDVEKRVQQGLMLEVDLLEAQEDLSNQRLGRLITAKQAADARESLVRLIEPYSDKIRWDMEIYVPSLLIQRQYDADLNKNLHAAMENRPELQQAEAVIDTLKINEMVSKNEMLPEFNLGYGLTWNGLGSQTRDSVENISIERQITDQISAYFEYPLFNRAAKSRYTRARYDLDRAFIDFDGLRMDIVVDVRSAIRNVEVTRSAIDVAQQSFELAVKKLEAEERRLDAGHSTLKDVLEFRQNKIRLETLRNRAKIDYEKSVDQLERATATSLAKYDIDILRDQVADKAFAAAREDSSEVAAAKDRKQPDGAK